MKVAVKTAGPGASPSTTASVASSSTPPVSAAVATPTVLPKFTIKSVTTLSGRPLTGVARQVALSSLNGAGRQVAVSSASGGGASVSTGVGVKRPLVRVNTPSATSKSTPHVRKLASAATYTGRISAVDDYKNILHEPAAPLIDEDDLHLPEKSLAQDDDDGDDYMSDDHDDDSDDDDSDGEVGRQEAVPPAAKKPRTTPSSQSGVVSKQVRFPDAVSKGNAVLSSVGSAPGAGGDTLVQSTPQAARKGGSPVSIRSKPPSTIGSATTVSATTTTVATSIASAGAAIPADGVGCLIPGCGKRQGRMCTYPAEGAVQTSWNNVLKAVFPGLRLDELDQQLKLICEDHFSPTDFDARGLIKPSAMPTQFPGGVKVVCNPTKKMTKSGTVTTCCVPGCLTKAFDKQMFQFPLHNFKSWVSIITVATKQSNECWIPGTLETDTGRPMQARVCKNHFSADNLTSKRSLKYGAHPTLFDKGKKRVVLKPMEQPKKGTYPTDSRRLMASRGPRYEPAGRVRGPIYVNVGEQGLQLVAKTGGHVPVAELTYSEMRRVSEAIKDKLRVEESQEEKIKLNRCLTELEPELAEKSRETSEDGVRSFMRTEVMSINPDMTDPELEKTVNMLKTTDIRRRELERSLARHFEDSDSYARESEGYISRIHALKRKVTTYESMYVRVFKYSDQREIMMGSSVIKWTIPTLTMARDILDRVGPTSYESLVQMGMPLPAVEVLSKAMELGASSEVGLVELEERRIAEGEADDEPQSPEQYVPDEDHTETGEGQQVQDSSPEPSDHHHQQLSAGQHRSVDKRGAEAPQESAELDETVETSQPGTGSLQAISADDIQNTLAGRGTLRDSRGRLIKVSLADVPGAAPGTKTVVMETPDDAEGVHYVPSA